MPFNWLKKQVKEPVSGSRLQVKISTKANNRGEGRGTVTRTGYAAQWKQG